MDHIFQRGGKLHRQFYGQCPAHRQSLFSPPGAAVVFLPGAPGRFCRRLCDTDRDDVFLSRDSFHPSADVAGHFGFNGFSGARRGLYLASVNVKYRDVGLLMPMLLL